MRSLLHFTTGVSALVGMVGYSGVAVAQTAPSQSDAARTVSQAAAATAEAADEAADAAIEAPPNTGQKGPVDRAREGIVIIERAGKPLALGTVLQGDGRILTALSPLGHGNNLDARFPDGSVTQLKVGHSDRAWDLALLVPQNGRYTKGLKASKLSATKAGSGLRAFSLVSAKSVAPARTIVRGRTTLVGGDSELLHDALEVASRFKASDVGTPIIDDHGDVVAVVARACAPTEQEVCSPVPFGVPVSAIKAFMRVAPKSALPPAPWLGIHGVADSSGPARGVRVMDVHPKSPAAAAGLKGGGDPKRADVVVAVDGAPVATPEALAQTISDRAVGDTVRLLVLGDGRFREVSLTLRANPEGGKSGVAPGGEAPAAQKLVPVPTQNKKNPRSPAAPR